jgi:hypothetical protein
MKHAFKQLTLVGCILFLGTGAMAKLPALSDEARSKAAEASAKSAWSAKVDGYLLCKSQDKVVAHTKKSPVGDKGAKIVAKDSKPAVIATSTCVDPGPFAFAPTVADAAPAAAVASSSPVPAKKP